MGPQPGFLTASAARLASDDEGAPNYEVLARVTSILSSSTVGACLVFVTYWGSSS